MPPLPSVTDRTYRTTQRGVKRNLNGVPPSFEEGLRDPLREPVRVQLRVVVIVRELRADRQRPGEDPHLADREKLPAVSRERDVEARAVEDAAGRPVAARRAVVSDREPFCARRRVDDLEDVAAAAVGGEPVVADALIGDRAAGGIP